jgi:DNA repair protein RadC
MENIELRDCTPVVFAHPSQVFDRLKYNFNDKNEVLFVIMMDVRLKVIGEFEMAIGESDRINFKKADLFRPIVASGCHRIVIAHNHPSRDVLPSIEDLKTTKTIQKCLKLLGIVLLDHVIFSDVKYYSMREMKNI